MHPEVCRFISEQLYEGRLASQPDTARQLGSGTRFPEAGASWVPVAHEGNAQVSTEEVAAISQATRRSVAVISCAPAGPATQTATLSDIKVQVFLRLEEIAHGDRIVSEEKHQSPVGPEG